MRVSGFVEKERTRREEATHLNSPRAAAADARAARSSSSSPVDPSLSLSTSKQRESRSFLHMIVRACLCFVCATIRVWKEKTRRYLYV